MTLIINDYEMNIDFSLSELFDRYLENDLTLLERQAFELRIQEDSVFAERFRLHKEVDQALVEDDILRFRHQLEKIGTNNSGLIVSTPMVIAEELTPEIDNAILEQDVIALRDQLSRIHSSVMEEIDAVGIAGYAGIERAILNQDSIALNKELSIYEEFASSETDVSGWELSALSQEVDNAILEDDVMMLREALSDIGDQVAATKKIVPIRRKVITYASTAIAAIFILVFAGSIFLNQNSGSFTSERTLSKTFQPYEGLGVTRGGSQEGMGVVDTGIQMFNESDFQGALRLLEAAFSDGTKDPTSLLYTGLSAYFVDDPGKALYYFGEIGVNEHTYDEQVQWYSAGCYFRMNEMEKAKAILKKITQDTEHFYYNEATKFLRKIEK